MPRWVRAVAFCALATLVAFGAFAPARAALEADPQALYQTMKSAYDRGAADGWNFESQELYFSTIVNAGRAYSLQRPNDPAYGELATLTVQVGSGVHYNPLTNHDAANWYVREAANWVLKNESDPKLLSQARSLLERSNAVDDPERLVQYADEDASANVESYPGDTTAMLQQAEADWRGWILTHDPQWRSLAFERTAQPNFPLAHLPTTYGNDLLTAAQSAAAGVAGYTAGDTANGKTIQARLKSIGTLRVIGSVTAMPHSKYLTTLAPADEYFGRMGFSILGMRNQLKHINFMLDYKYGNRESGEAVLVAHAIDDMHKVYPRDRAIPEMLLEGYTTLERMTTPQALAAAAHLRSILTVEYQDTPQARKLLAPAQSPD